MADEITPKVINLVELPTSKLTNTDKYLTKRYLEVELKGDDFSEYIKEKIVPTAVSAFDNDSGYITETGPIWTRLQSLIPTEAIAPGDKDTEGNPLISNLLADKKYVDEHVSSSLATFVGSFTDKATFDTTVAGKEYKNGDYAVVLADETNGGTLTDVTGSSTGGETWRYKFTGEKWEAEYRVNETALTQSQLDAINSGITAALVKTFSEKQDALDEEQLAAVNSGITAEKVAAYDRYETTKQDVLSFASLEDILEGSCDITGSSHIHSNAVVQAGVLSEALATKQDNLTFITGSQFSDGVTEAEKSSVVNAGALTEILSAYTQSSGFDEAPTEGHTGYMISSDVLYTIVTGLLSRIEALETRVNELTEGSQLSYVDSGIDQSN